MQGPPTQYGMNQGGGGNRYRPPEIHSLEALAAAVAAGLDPSTAMSLYSGLQSGAQTRWTAQAENQANQRPQLTPEEIADVYKDAVAMAVGDTEKGIPPKPMWQARQLIDYQFRAQGYSEQDIATIYDAIGKAYQAAGGPMGNTPLTYADKLLQQAMPPAPPAAQAVVPPTPPPQPVGALGPIGTNTGLYNPGLNQNTGLYNPGLNRGTGLFR